jgi:hypothetical protein
MNCNVARTCCINTHQHHLECRVKQSVCTLGALSTNRRTQEITNGLFFVILQQYSVGGQELLQHIVTGDETWIHHHNLETKLASM